MGQLGQGCNCGPHPIPTIDEVYVTIWLLLLEVLEVWSNFFKDLRRI